MVGYIFIVTKRKDSLETRAEPAVLHAYIENQVMLEPILLYRASKYKQTKKREKLKLFKDLLVNLRDYHFFFFCLVKHARIQLCHNRSQYIKVTQVS